MNIDDMRAPSIDQAPQEGSSVQTSGPLQPSAELLKKGQQSEVNAQSTSMAKGRVDSLSLVKDDDDDDDKGNMLAQLEFDEDAGMDNSDDDENDDARKTFALGRDPDAMLNRVTKQFDLARSRRLRNAGAENYFLNPIKRALEEPS